MSYQVFFFLPVLALCKSTVLSLINFSFHFLGNMFFQALSAFHLCQPTSILLLKISMRLDFYGKNLLSFVHTLCIHCAHAAANLNSGYSKYTKVARVHYFCTIALRTSHAVLSKFTRKSKYAFINLLLSFYNNSFSYYFQHAHVLHNKYFFYQL